jgi:hypothetical protein
MINKLIIIIKFIELKENQKKINLKLINILEKNKKNNIKIISHNVQIKLKGNKL